MTDNDTDKPRCNLVFSGQLLPGTDKARAKRTLAAFFGLRDVGGIEGFFSGKPVPLRRNITRSDAQRLYRQLRGVGLICELFPVELPVAPAAPPAPPLSPPPKPSSKPPAAPRSQPRPAPAPAPPPAPAAASGGKAPNLFALRPAVASNSAGRMSEAAQIRGIIAGGTALALCALIVAVALRFPAAPAGREPLGPLAGTTLAGNELLILLESALLVHERSGLPKRRISASELGFERLAPPLWSMDSGELLLNASKGEEPLRLQRCNLDELSCYTFSPQTQESPVTAIASSLLGEHIFLLGARGELWHSNSAGEITTQARVQTPWGHPRLLASGGLLLVPAGDGPMLGVYRPDQKNFGQQLDALLVMPAQALTRGQDRLRDVALGDLNNWALMAGDTAAPGLFKLDKQWGNAQEITLSTAFFEAFFIPWRDKLLIADPRQGAMQRLSIDGTLETPFTSALLTREREDWLRLSRQRSLVRQLGMGLPLLLAMFCATAALLYFASYRSQTMLPQRRSALLDPMPGGVFWLPASSQRAPAVQRTGLGLVLCCAGAMAVFGGLGGWRSGLACLPALAACAYAWSELRRGSGGHLGLLDKHFIAVDYDGRYFYGERSMLRGNQSVALAPGLALPLGLPGLPNLDALDDTLHSYAPAQKSSVSDTLGALWSCGHPWLNAALAVAAGILLSLGLLLVIR